jgi:hypothetical protein
MAATAECVNCKQSLPAQHSGPCPYCGGSVIVKRGLDNGVAIDDHIRVEATTYELTDQEFDTILRDALKKYLRESLGAKKITTLDKSKEMEDVKLKVLQSIPNSNFASVVAAYLSLRSAEQQTASQEQQGNMQLQQAELNVRLQWLIALVAIGTLVTGFLSVVLPYLYPR